MKKSDLKILVAEDDEMVRDVVAKFLTGEGYPVILASDGISALDILRREDIRMVITDLRMPGADGMDVLRTALQIDPQMTVVLTTAYGTLDIALEAMKEGAYDYLVKPFVMQQLLLVVRNAFKLWGLIEENRKLQSQLKETYRNLENSKGRAAGIDETMKAESSDRIERLRELNIIDTEEAAILKNRMTGTDQSDSVKKYSSLVNNLRVEKR